MVWLQGRTSVRAVGLSSSLSQLCCPRRQKGAGGAAESWQQGEGSSLCSPAEKHRMRDQLPWWLWPVELLCLPWCYLTLGPWDGPKSGAVNLHFVVSLNLIALSFFSFDTQCTSLLSAFTLFWVLIFVVFLGLFCGKIMSRWRWDSSILFTANSWGH